MELYSKAQDLASGGGVWVVGSSLGRPVNLCVNQRGVSDAERNIETDRLGTS